MVLLLIKVECKEDILNGELIRLEGLLSSLGEQDGYCTHSINIGLKEEEKLLLIIEWRTEEAAKNYLITEEFKSLVAAMRKVGEKHSTTLAGVLSRGGIEIALEPISSPAIL